MTAVLVSAAQPKEVLLKETDKYKLYGKEDKKKYDEYRYEVKTGQELSAEEMIDTIIIEEKKKIFH